MRFTPLLLTALAAAVPQMSSAAELALKPCRLRGVPTEVQCGDLVRPLNPAEPAGASIKLRVAVVPALARNKLPDPVVLLAGGPGQAAVGLADLIVPRYRKLNNRRDLILVDQRGTGESAPLDCPDERTISLAEAFQPERALKRLAECREALKKLPYGDLRQFTTTIAMQDLDAVRQALGIQQWNLIGASYGTRAALEYLRLFPQAVRRTVIDGVAPPDMVLPASFSTDTQTALDALFASCAAQPQCQQAYPQLQAEWQQVLNGLPRSVTLRHPVSGALETITLRRDDVLRAVRSPLYAPTLASALPAAIHAAAKGDFDGLGGLASGLGGGRGAMKLATGMHFSVVCAEDAPRLSAATDAPGRDYQGMDKAFYGAVCTDWPRGAVPEAFYTVPPAKSPVWVLSGGADPVTPPRHGDRVAKALGALAKHEVVPAAGHGVLALGCVRDALTKFIEAKTDADALKASAECASTMPRPLAFIPPLTLPVSSKASDAK
ncbi:alpha/beta fold hydrolase [Inhella gelatinilytica]|uniref:Alpha/beta fold hydrolase n=1 Tax=Inhella gelatinilytica TaxID=2795030 RepID=A0A931IW54_9BURK|nr:alpha/beta fold hydrolase [Inhella gelatinilytica]MBH9552119.1 alpha/beta fold hydrolase [Inhella gelatinilytica]